MGYQFFSREMNEKAIERFNLTIQMKHAINNDEFSLVYQPQIDIRTGIPVGAEALLRWDNDEMKAVSPAVYIAAAEENGLIDEIGFWVLRRACRQTAAWIHSGLISFPVSVNVSAKQFMGRSFVQRVSKILEETGLDPGFLELELTESMLIEDVEQVSTLLNELKKIGVFLAIDDFGTGYSSLGYLKNFPIDKLKIDRIFVSDVDTVPADRQIAAAIVGLGKAMGLTIIAEGVERSSQANILEELGCTQVQGYYYSRPLYAQVFERFMGDKRSISSVR